MMANLRGEEREAGKQSGFDFVGRRQELNQLLLGLEQAQTGRGKVLSLVGEPGIGKTRLASEFALLARERGARVFWAFALRHLGVETPPYWLWTHLLRQTVSADGLSGMWNPQSQEVPAAINDIAEVPELSPRSTRDLPFIPESAAPWLRLFEATAQRLLSLARVQPVVIVLDDLGAADRLSLLALEFIASRLRGVAIVIVATYRETEMRSLFAANALPSGRVLCGNRVIQLRALSAAETGQLMEQRAGRKTDPMFAERVAGLTRGNPRFVELLLPDGRLPQLAESETPRALPHALLAAAEQHLSSLSAVARGILSVAAVIGREFDLATLRALSEGATADLLDVLADARTAGLLEREDCAPGLYRFAHPLVWQALYDSLPGSRRASLHHEAGRFLERAFGYDRARLGQLARHFHEGGLFGGAQKAVDYWRRAGDHAMETSRFEDASRFYGMAGAALSLGSALDDPARCDLLLSTAEAQTRARHLIAARESFRQAAELAETLQDAGRFARAALGRAGSPLAASTEPDPENVSLLTRALDLVGDREGVARVRLLLRLASELHCQSGASARRDELEREAEAIARRLGDHQAEFAVLRHRHLFVSCAPESIEEQLAGTERMLTVVRHGTRLEDWMAALTCRYAALLRKGSDVSSNSAFEPGSTADGVVESCVLQRGYRYHAAIRALLEGRFREGASLVTRFLTATHAVFDLEGWDVLWPALITPFCELGKLAEVMPFAARAVDQNRGVPVFRALRMKTLLLCQHLEEARQDFEELAACDFEDLPRDIGFLTCLLALAEMCVALRDERRATLLYGLLRPHEGLNAVFGPLAFFGPVSHALGLLSDLTGEFEAAANHFEHALLSTAKLRARPWLAYTQHDYGRTLLRGGDAAGREKARKLLTDALAAAEHMGMRDLVRRLCSLQGQAMDSPEARVAAAMPCAALAAVQPAIPVRAHKGAHHPETDMCAEVRSTVMDAARERAAADGPQDRPADSVSSSADQWVFMREGDYWTISFHGKVVRLRHTRGLAYMAQLLQYPGRQFHAADLVATAEGLNGASIGQTATRAGTGDLQNGGPHGGDSGPVLDTDAKAAYKRRIRELRHELEEAKSFNDLGRTTKIGDEISFITSELAVAVGLGGAGERKLGSETERARINVTNAVRSVVQKLRRDHPELSRYLAITISTGSFCSFEPGPGLPRTWRVSMRP